jgi:hypothetical protein
MVGLRMRHGLALVCGRGREKARESARAKERECVCERIRHGLALVCGKERERERERMPACVCAFGYVPLSVPV